MSNMLDYIEWRGDIPFTAAPFNEVDNLVLARLSYIENGNTRTAMAKGDVLLMKEARYPTVIVECGFLSNAEEAELLQTDEYQDTVSRAIADGILGYLGIEKKEFSDIIKIITS